MTSPAPDLAQVVAELSVAGYRALKVVEPLCLGTSNQNFLLNNDDGDWVLRINNPLTDRLCPRANEVACWRMAAQHNLAPELVFVACDYRYYLSRYVRETLPWQSHYSHHPQATQLIAELLQRLGRLPTPTHQVTPREQWLFYKDMLAQRAPEFTPKLHYIHKKIQDAETSIEAALTRLGSDTALQFCHRDLNPNNLLLAGNQLMCIDFEYACASIAGMELVALFATHTLSPAQKDLISTKILGLDARQRSQHLADAETLYWWFTVCWALMMCTDGREAMNWLDNALEKLSQ